MTTRASEIRRPNREDGGGLPGANANDLDDGTRERARTLSTLLRAGMVVLALGALSALFRGAAVRIALFTYVGMLIEHVIAYGLARSGRLRLAVAVHVTLYLAMVGLVMYQYGGIRSPAGFVLPPIILLAGLTWNGRAGLVTALAAAGLTFGFLALERRGLLPPATSPPPDRLAVAIAATLVITASILALALRTIEKARARALEHQRARLRAEESLAQTRTLDTVASLAAGVAHDFNNILTVIMGMAGVIQKNADARTVELARAIEEATIRAGSLTRLLLAFGRGQAVVPRLIEVNAVVREAEPLLHRFAGDSQLVLELAESLGRVRADPTQLQQVLLNLVGNARDAMPGAGAVTVRTGPATPGQLTRAEWPLAPGHPSVALQVIDTGEGMTAEVAARAFEPFFTTKAPGKGTGIGLASVREIVEQCGGVIWVESRPGAGSAFTILLRAGA